MIAKCIGPFKQKKFYLNHAVLLVDYLLQMLKSPQQVALSFILYFSFACLKIPFFFKINITCSSSRFPCDV